VENDVIRSALRGEALFRIVDELVGAKTTQHRFLDATVDRRDSGLHGLGNLHRMRADAATGAIDQHRLADGESGDVLAERGDLTGEVAAEDSLPGSPHAECQPQRQPEPLDRVPEAAHLAVGLGGLGGRKPDQDFIVARYGLRELLELKDLGRPTTGVGDGLHAWVGRFCITSAA